MLVVGLDLGSQSLKAVVCDDRLTVFGKHAVPYPTSRPEPDRAEQDPRAWEQALGAAIGRALEVARARPHDVGVIAIAGQLDGCVAVDGGGQPLHPALIWQDRRAVVQAKRASVEDVFAIAGQVADASHMAPKICWLREQGIRAARFHQPVSYLVERLTGRAVMDPSLASTTMLAELATGRWSQALLDAFAITAQELPAIVGATEIAGVLTPEGARLTGLRPGTRVAVGTGDDFANPLGAGVVAPGSIGCAVGPAEVVGALSEAPVLDRVGAEPMVETHAYPTGAYFIENPGWLSGGAVRWAAAMLGLEDDAELDRLAASAPPGAGGVTFIPALAGAMTPVWRPEARGTLHGLAAGHRQSHVARAVLEGLTFASRDVAERLVALGLPADDVLLLGGGANSRVWSQLRADVLGLPHRVASVVDTCPLGAAMIGAVAAGLHADLYTAAATVEPACELFAPQPATRGALDAAYRRFQTLVTRLAVSGVV